MDDLFGGSESKTEQGSSSFSNQESQGTSGSVGSNFGISTPFDFTPEAFAGLRDSFSQFLAQSFGGAGGDWMNFNSDAAKGTLSPVNPNEQSLLDSLMADSQGGQRTDFLNNIMGGSGSFLSPQVMQALTALMGGTDQAGSFFGNTISGHFLDANNPHLQAAIEAAQRPTLQGLEELLTRALPGRFTQAGHFTQPQGSSAFDRAAAIATRGAGDTMGDIATNMSFQSHALERQLQQQAAQLMQGGQLAGTELMGAGDLASQGLRQQAVGLSQAEVDTTIKNLEAQQLPRLIEQFGVEAGLKEFQTRTAAILDVLRTVAGITSPTLGTTSVEAGGTASASQQTASGVSGSESFGQSTSDTSSGIIPGLGSLFSFGLTKKLA